jgi:plastocyanin
MASKLTNRLMFAAAPLAVMLLFTACNGQPGDVDTAQPEEEVGVVEVEDEDEDEAENGEAVEISLTAEGREFFFDGEDEGNPDIVVQQGDTVEVTLCVTGGTHDWMVDEFDVATDTLSEGDECSTVEFVADEAGEFEYYCSVGNHRDEGMVGMLIVEAADDEDEAAE